MRIAYENLIDANIAVIEASSEDTLYPIENVQDQRLSTAWHSSDTSTQTIIVDLGKKCSVDTVIIMGHNLVTNATIQVNANDIIRYASTTGAMTWYASTQTSAETITYNAGMALKFITSAAYRYWQFTLLNYATPAAREWTAIVWCPELSKFVTLSRTLTSNLVATSGNGINWETSETGENKRWTSLVWVAELTLFVAVAWGGSDERIMTSPDGTTWTARATDGRDGKTWLSVAWSARKEYFIAVAGDSSTTSTVIYSTDGETWANRTAATAGEWASVCWGEEAGVFVAVGTAATTATVMTTSSDNGTSWTARTAAAANEWRSVCWSSKLRLFCAVASSGSGNRVMTSPNGTTWTARTSAADNNWRTVIWVDELTLFVAVADSGTQDRVMTSPDGVTWTSRTTTDHEWAWVAWSPELSLLVATNREDASPIVMTSPDGITWTDRTGTDGNIEIGRLWLGEYLDIDPTSLDSFSVKKKRSDRVIYGRNRQKWADEGVGWREFSLDFPPSNSTMVTAIQTMYDAVGNHSSIVFCNFDSIRDYEIVEPVYCSIVGELEFRHKGRQRYEYSLTLEEDR